MEEFSFLFAVCFIDDNLGAVILLFINYYSMENFKELTQEHTLSDDKVFDMVGAPPTVRETFSVFPINKQYLSEIHAGMVWYDDDTVSDDILENRTVKAVVLAVIGNKIIGDSGSEVLCAWLKGRAFACSFNNDFIMRGEASLLSIEELEQVVLNRNIFNHTLEMLGWKLWCDYSGYWSATPEKEYNAWLLMVGPNIRRSFDRAFHMFARPVIVKTL